MSNLIHDSFPDPLGANYFEDPLGNKINTETGKLIEELGSEIETEEEVDVEENLYDYEIKPNNVFRARIGDNANIADNQENLNEEPAVLLQNRIEPLNQANLGGQRPAAIIHNKIIQPIKNAFDSVGEFFGRVRDRVSARAAPANPAPAQVNPAPAQVNPAPVNPVPVPVYVPAPLQENQPLNIPPQAAEGPNVPLELNQNVINTIQIRNPELIDNNIIVENEEQPVQQNPELRRHLSEWQTKIDTANALPANSTQTVLLGAHDDLKHIVGIDENSIRVKSKLNKGAGNSGYQLETYKTSTTPPEFCYKIKVQYIIEFRVNGQLYKKTINREIFTSIQVGSSPQQALLLASKYKEMMVQMAMPEAGRVQNYPRGEDDNVRNQREALLKQHCFTFDLKLQNGQIGVSSISVPKDNENPNNPNNALFNNLKLGIAPNPDRHYVKTIGENPAGKGKARLEEIPLQSHEVKYASKDEAILHARFTINNNPVEFDDFVNELTSNPQFKALDSPIVFMQKQIEKKKKEVEEAQQKLINDPDVDQLEQSERYQKFQAEMIYQKNIQRGNNVVDNLNLSENRRKVIENTKDKIQLEALEGGINPDNIPLLEELYRKYNQGQEPMPSFGNLVQAQNFINDLLPRLNASITQLEAVIKSDQEKFKKDFIEFQHLNSELKHLNEQSISMYNLAVNKINVEGSRQDKAKYKKFIRNGDKKLMRKVREYSGNNEILCNRVAGQIKISGEIAIPNLRVGDNA